MAHLPIIVGFGGVNAAGRSSAHHGYRRTVIESLADSAATETWRSLAAMMQLDLSQATAEQIPQIREQTLIRAIEESHFDTENIPWNRRVNLRPEPERPIFFDLRTKHLPAQIPSSWEISHMDDRTVRVVVRDSCEMLLPDSRQSDVRAAGQLPSGFNPGKLYQSRNHPRGLQMTLFAASDALRSTGIDWNDVQRHVAPDKISVYAGSAMSQLDQPGNGGMMSSRAFGKRVTSKQCALGFAEMPADFINAYVLGSVGMTGTSMGACASFLYNLRMGVADIQSGRARVAIVGNSEAPITPEVMEGYAAMGALATDKSLRELDGKTEFESADHRRACRPFSTNSGFTIAESAQFLVLFDDALALELGANVYGAVDNVFVNADGHKKSISAPGVGNYITVAKALASAQQLVGQESIRHRSVVQAHGTGTPQNRVTESHVLNECAKAFGIQSWPVAAVKCFLGHSIGVAAGDQIASTLGLWEYGILPGIRSIDHVAEDVHQSNLALSPDHQDLGAKAVDTAIINAKGFGGNNASASLLAPHVAHELLAKRHGAKTVSTWQMRNEAVQESIKEWDQHASAGDLSPVYKFDHNVMTGDHVKFEDGTLFLEGYEGIDLFQPSPYSDLENNDA